MKEFIDISDESEVKSMGNENKKKESLPSPVLSGVRPVGRPSKQSISTLDEGIDYSLDPLIESIGQPIKRRKIVTNWKKFDLKYSLDSIFDAFDDKDTIKENTIIEFENSEIIDKKDFVEQTVLETKSVTNKEPIRCPEMTPTPRPNRRLTEVRQQSVGIEVHKSGAEDWMTINQLWAKSWAQPFRESITSTGNTSNEQMAINHSDFKQHESKANKQSEELIENVCEDSNPIGMGSHHKTLKGLSRQLSETDRKLLLSQQICRQLEKIFELSKEVSHITEGLFNRMNGRTTRKVDDLQKRVTSKKEELKSLEDSLQLLRDIETNGFGFDFEFMSYELCKTSPSVYCML